MGKRPRTEPDGDHVTGKRILNGYGRPCSVLASPVMSLSSQSDNEADIVWGHSPPPLNLKLSGTPGPKTRRRSDYGSRDIADMIGCINNRNSSQKQSPNASTPPLLGLWMQDRTTNVQSTPVNGRGGQRFPRRISSRRPPGDSWASLAKDLHMLAELSQTSRLQQPTSSESDEAEQDPLRGEEPSIDGELDGIIPDETVENPIVLPTSREADKENFATPKRSRQDQSASVESPMDDVWEDDSWFENESFVTIATQLEEEAFSKRPHSGLAGLNPVCNKDPQTSAKMSSSRNKVPSSSTHVEAVPTGDHQFCPPKVNRTFKHPGEPGASRRSPEGVPPTQTRSTFQFSRKPGQFSKSSPPASSASGQFHNQSQKHGKVAPAGPSSTTDIDTCTLSGRIHPDTLRNNDNASPRVSQVPTLSRSRFGGVSASKNLHVNNAIDQTARTEPRAGKCKSERVLRDCEVTEGTSHDKVNSSANSAAKVGPNSSLKVSPPSMTVRSQFGKAAKSLPNRTQVSVDAGKTGGIAPCKPPLSSGSIRGGQFSRSGRITKTSPSSNTGNRFIHPPPELEGSRGSSEVDSDLKSGIPARPGNRNQFNSGRVPRISPPPAPNIPGPKTVQRPATSSNATRDEVDTGEVSPANLNVSFDLFDSSIGNEDVDAAEGMDLDPEEAQNDANGGTEPAEMDRVKNRRRSENRRESDMFSESSLMDEELLAAVELEEKNWEMVCSQRTLGDVGSPAKDKGGIQEHLAGLSKAPSFVKDIQGGPNGLPLRGVKDTGRAHSTLSEVARPSSKFSQFKAPLSSQFSFSLKGKGPISKASVSGSTTAVVGSSMHSGVASLHVPANSSCSRAPSGTMPHSSPSKNPKTVIGNPVNTNLSPGADGLKNVNKEPQRRRATFQFKGSQFNQAKAMSPVKLAPKPQFSCTTEQEPAPSLPSRQFQHETSGAGSSATAISQQTCQASTSRQFQLKMIQTEVCADQTPHCPSDSLLNLSTFSQTSSQFSSSSQLKTTTDESTSNEISPSPVFRANRQTVGSLKETNSLVREIGDGKPSDGHHGPSTQGSRTKGQFFRVQKLSPDQCVKAAAVAGNRNVPPNVKSLAKLGNNAPLPGRHLLPSGGTRSNPQFTGVRKLSPNQSIKAAATVEPMVSDVPNKQSRTGNSPPAGEGSCADSRRLSDECVGPSQGIGNSVSQWSRKQGPLQFAIPKPSQKDGQKIDVWQDSTSLSSTCGGGEQGPKQVSNVLRTLSGSTNELPRFGRVIAGTTLRRKGAAQAVVAQPNVQPTGATKLPDHRKECTALDNSRFTCSQEEIERKRQEALARKKQKENLLGSHRMSLRNRPMKNS